MHCFKLLNETVLDSVGHTRVSWMSWLYFHKIY